MELESILGKDDFLTLLLAQIQNQNPLDPMSNEDFTQQLALFTQIEKLDTVATAMEDLLECQQTMVSAMAVDLIGKEVTGAGDQIELSDPEQGSDIPFHLEDQASDVSVIIADETGSVVRLLTLHNLDSGDHTAFWDGLDSQGDQVASGTYTIGIAAQDAEGATVSATTYQKGTVTGVSFEDGVTYLTVNGAKVSLAEVTEIQNAAG